MVMVSTRRDERRRVPESLHQLEPKYAAVKPQRSFQIRYLQVDVAHPDPCIDRQIVHVDWMNFVSVTHYTPLKKTQSLRSLIASAAGGREYAFSINWDVPGVPGKTNTEEPQC
jgi:hypothetical protein